jgi:hypothetical protein
MTSSYSGARAGIVGSVTPGSGSRMNLYPEWRVGDDHVPSISAHPKPLTVLVGSPGGIGQVQ